MTFVRVMVAAPYRPMNLDDLDKQQAADYHTAWFNKPRSKAAIRGAGSGMTRADHGCGANPRRS